MGVICDVNQAPESCVCHLRVAPVTVVREVHIQSPVLHHVPAPAPVQVPVPVHVPAPVQYVPAPVHVPPLTSTYTHVPYVTTNLHRSNLHSSFVPALHSPVLTYSNNVHVSKKVDWSTERHKKWLDIDILLISFTKYILTYFNITHNISGRDGLLRNV